MENISKNLDNNHLSSKPQHRWAEGGKELNELWQMIIHDVSQEYNHKPHDTHKTCHLSKVSHMIINEVAYIINMLHHDGH